MYLLLQKPRGEELPPSVAFDDAFCYSVYLRRTCRHEDRKPHYRSALVESYRTERRLCQLLVPPSAASMRLGALASTEQQQDKTGFNVRC